MRLLLAAITFVCLITLTPRSMGTSPFLPCGCSAADGSCSVNGNCPRGCLAYCPSNNCRLMCVGVAYEEMMDASVPITLRLKDANSRKVAAELKRLTGAEVIFNPRQPDHVFNVDVKDEPLWNVLESLSSEGNIQVAREDFGHLRSVRQSFLSGERMEVCFQNVTAKRLATDLSFLTGRDVYVSSGDPKTLVYYKGKAVTFDEMVAEVSQKSGAVIAIR